MHEDCRGVRFNWEPLVRRGDDPRTGHPGHLVNHFSLLSLLPDMLDDRIGEREVDVVVLEGHVAGIGDHEGV